MTPHAASPRLLSRRSFLIATVPLVVILVALLAALFLLLIGPRTTHRTVAGVRPLHVIYGPGVGSEPLFDRPMGAAFGKYGRIYVADTGNNRIVVFTAGGKYLFQWGRLGVAKPAAGGVYSWKRGRLNYPTDVATDARGNVYVADFYNDQIQVFDANGTWLRVFPDRSKRVGKGASGQGGHGVAVTSLAVDGDVVYVTDRYQVLEFTTGGRFVAQFGKPGMGPADLDHPNGIAAGPSFTVIVSDSNHNRIVNLTSSGKRSWSIGESLGMDLGRSTKTFEMPRGIAKLDDGSYMVIDSLTSRLVNVSAVGKVIGTYGQRGNAPGEFDFPMDVAAQGEKLLVAEKGLDRVQVVTLVPR